MTKKRIIKSITAFALLFSFSTTHVFAGINLGNQDGTGFSSGTSNNYWGVHTDSGTSLNETEGLRVTIYDAETNKKVFNTIDISGNSNISAVSDMNYFADGNELVSKTTWLNYIGGIYNSVSPSDMARFNDIVTSKNCFGSDYKIQYVAELSTVDIVSVNNTSHLEAIKAILGDEQFLTDLCALMGGGLTYEDISKGKYKIAFEPVAYFRYNGQNWAMSATECGLLNKYMKNYFFPHGTVRIISVRFSDRLRTPTCRALLSLKIRTLEFQCIRPPQATITMEIPTTTATPALSAVWE